VVVVYVCVCNGSHCLVLTAVLWWCQHC
jgi:hypothetical protein